MAEKLPITGCQFGSKAVNIYLLAAFYIKGNVLGGEYETAIDKKSGTGIGA